MKAGVGLEIPIAKLNDIPSVTPTPTVFVFVELLPELTLVELLVVLLDGGGEGDEGPKS